MDTEKKIDSYNSDLLEDPADNPAVSAEVAIDDKNLKTEILPVGDITDLKSELEESLHNASESEFAPVKISESSESEPNEKPQTDAAKKTAKEPDPQKITSPLSAANKILSVALIMLIIVGFSLYFNPSLIGLTKTRQTAIPASAEIIESVKPIPQPVSRPSPPSKRDQCLAKLEEAVQLRNELLEKKNEILELELNYRDGITELEREIHQEIQKGNIRSYKEAIKNMRLELNLRTIQRRQTYIRELTKPADWLYSGSEELLYLIRKAQLDLELTEIAGGIDLNKHMRYLSAAIQKYHLTPDKLAIDPLQPKVQPLEKIWEQVSNKKLENNQISSNSKDAIIINQICSGNFDRIAELTSISPRAASCLSRMKGSDLFLNRLTAISPDAAQQIFKWQGDWICLNGIKRLSPAVAQYLFLWKGKWISLNSLHEFPPELAKHLLQWEGQQLELMGLEYEENEANLRTLKYLALWETTGGKLFVADKIRRKMSELM